MSDTRSAKLFVDRQALARLYFQSNNWLTKNKPMKFIITVSACNADNSVDFAIKQYAECSVSVYKIDDLSAISYANTNYD
jgi:hypothetical protein